MNSAGVFSLSIRVAAVSMLVAGLVWQAPPVRSAVPAFQATPVAPKVPGLVGYWPMNSATGGVTKDMSGTVPANDGTLNGSATIDTTNKAAVPSANPGSLGVSASGDTVSVPDSPSLSVTGSLTVAAWIRPTVARVVAPATGPQHGIIEKWDYGTTATNGYFLRLTSGNHVGFAVANASTYSDIDTSPRYIPTNTWTHVAGVYDLATQSMKIYNSNDDLVAGPTGYGPDGGIEDPTTGSGVTAPTNGTSYLSIGDGLGAQQFGGNIDEARVYNKALTTNEIAILVSMNQPPATGFTATAQGNQVNLSWTAASNAGTVPVVYSVLRGTSAGAYDTVVDNISAVTSTVTYTDTPTTAGTYFYTVAAVSVIPSAYATEMSVTTTSSTPTPTPTPTPSGPKGPDGKSCGCGTAGAIDGTGMAVAAAMLAALAVTARRRPS